jgi:hypothetical protein
MTAKQIAAAAEYVAEAQRILDRAIEAGNDTLIDVYTREVAIRKNIIRKEGY